MPGDPAEFTTSARQLLRRVTRLTPKVASRCCEKTHPFEEPHRPRAPEGTGVAFRYGAASMAGGAHRRCRASRVLEQLLRAVRVRRRRVRRRKPADPGVVARGWSADVGARAACRGTACRERVVRAQLRARRSERVGLPRLECV